VDIRRSGGLLREHGGDAEKRGFDESEGLHDELTGLGGVDVFKHRLDDRIDIHG
jgi:hypothetical protein